VQSGELIKQVSRAEISLSPTCVRQLMKHELIRLRSAARRPVRLNCFWLRILTLVLQVLVYLRGGDGTFSDAGGDAFDRTMADVASGEYAREACLQRKGQAPERPAGRLIARARQVGSGENEPVLVALY
jgi:hypothetical protein